LASKHPQIPNAVITLLSDLVPDAETHTSLDSLFKMAGCPGDPPDTSKSAKVVEWLIRVNKDPAIKPLTVLGSILERYMEIHIVDALLGDVDEWDIKDKIQLEEVLKRHDLSYVSPGKVVQINMGTSTEALSSVIRERDFRAVEDEFARALENVATDPRESVSAACNILESLFKIVIEDERLGVPRKQDLPGLWKVIRDYFGFDASSVEDQDLSRIVGGLASVAVGIGALRTHASRAHGSGRSRYKIDARHARLAVHSASTLAVFVIETWDLRKYAHA